MERTRKTIVGVFSNLPDAKRATDELRNLGFSAVRLVENDQDPTFVGTTERSGLDTTIAQPKQGGISGFFSRLFGFDDNRSDWNLSSDSEAYFQDTYNSRHHLVIVDNCSDISRCSAVIVNQGGVVEEQGSQYYEAQLFRDGSTLDSERVMELREEQLDVSTERVQAGEVSVRKEIITEMKTVEVPVTREEIVVERRPLHGAAHAGSLDLADQGETTEIRVPVSEEHIHVEKKVVPREEIRVSKEKITDKESVSEQVRREEARVESEGRVAMKNKVSKDRPSAQPGL